MSLKGFHIVFVTVCTLLFAFLALWAFVLTSESSGWVSVLGGIGICGVVLMLTYGVYFYRKLQTLHI